LALISVPTFDLSFLGRISGFNVNKTVYFCRDKKYFYVYENKEMSAILSVEDAKSV